MKFAFVEAAKAFVKQAKSNYAEVIKKEYNKLYPSKTDSKESK